MKMVIAGGCFIQQHNIPFSKLYHQTIKRLLIENNIQVVIETLRYERISTCIDKIKQLKKIYDFDFLIFHLRAEPSMRLSKLYYKYLDDKGKLKHAFNLPFLKILYPEKFEILAQRRINSDIQLIENESKSHHILREINYLLGSFIGNKKFALLLLEKTTLQIQSFCTNNNIQFLLLGPVNRPFSYFENKLSEEISKKFEHVAKVYSIPYLSLLKMETSSNESMFFENGIHISQAGHNEIASMIYQKIINDHLCDNAFE